METNAQLLVKIEALMSKETEVNHKHAAQLVGVSTVHLYRLNLHPDPDNVLPRVKKSNKRVMYRLSDLLVFIKRRMSNEH